MADRMVSNGTTQWIRADRLKVDPVYQRNRNERKIREIIEEFDADAFGILYVSRRADGSLALIDGQQRHSAFLESPDFSGDQKVECLVFTGLTVAEEAMLYYRYNEVRTKPTAYDLHKAALVAGEERAVAVEATVRAQGLHVMPGNNTGYVQCIAKLNEIFDHAGRSVLRRTLRIAAGAWGIDSTSFQADVLGGIAVIIARHPHVDDGRMTRVLSKLDPSLIRQKAQVLKAQLGAGGGGGNVARVSSVVAGLIVTRYNMRLGKDKQVHWDSELTGRAYWQKAS